MSPLLVTLLAPTQAQPVLMSSVSFEPVVYVEPSLGSNSPFALVLKSLLRSPGVNPLGGEPTVAPVLV